MPSPIPSVLLTLVLLLPSASTWSQSYADAFKRVRTSVVVLLTKESLPAAGAQAGTKASLPGTGSGVLISARGDILTAAHIVHLADSVNVMFADSTILPGRVVSSEPRADLALVRVIRPPAAALPAVLGNSDSVDIGDPVFVIGAPYGLSYSLSAGLISGRLPVGSDDADFSEAEFFQTDAAINMGNSGGPVFDNDGRVIGIVSYMLSRSGGYEGLGFAVTSGTARRLLLEGPGIWGGLQTKPIRGALAAALTMVPRGGLLVERVARGSFGDSLGLKGGDVEAVVGGETVILGGDILLTVAGVDLRDDSPGKRLRSAIRQLTPGATVTATALRNGREVTLKTSWKPYSP